MRSLDEGFGIKTVTYESGIRVIVAGEKRDLLGVCLDGGGLAYLVPIFSPTGRMFFNSATNRQGTSDRFYFVPTGAQIGSRIQNYSVYATDCPDFLVLDLTGVQEREIILRIPEEDGPSDDIGKLFAIDLTTDSVTAFGETIEYDLHLCGIVDILESQPIPGYEDQKYSFSEYDWTTLSVPPFYAFPDLPEFAEDEETTSDIANGGEESDSGDDFTAEDLNS